MYPNNIYSPFAFKVVVDKILSGPFFCLISSVSLTWF